MEQKVKNLQAEVIHMGWEVRDISKHIDKKLPGTSAHLNQLKQMNKLIKKSMDLSKQIQQIINENQD